MKNTFIAIIIILCLSAFCVSDNKKVFKKLYALEGTWQMKTKKGFICEEWKKINNNHLQSKGYTISGNDTTITERVTLKRIKNSIVYASTVENQNNKLPIVFTFTKEENNLFIFENPQHDFPKRIVYKLISSDSLNAFIDDGIDSSKKRQYFFYKKVK